MAEGVHAVLLAQLLLFLAEIESVAGAAGDDQIERLGVVLVQLVFRGGFLQGGHAVVDGLAKFAAALHARGSDLGTHLQVVDFDARHLVHVHVVAGREEIVRIVAAAQEACGAAFADNVALLQRPRHHHEWQRRLHRRFQTHHLTAVMRIVARRRRLELPRWAHRVRLVAGHHLVDRGGVIEEACGRVIE